MRQFQHHKPSRGRYVLENRYNRRFIAKHKLKEGPRETGVTVLGDGNPHQTVWLRNVDRLLNIVPAQEQKTFVDIGAGSGIAMYYVAQTRTFSKITGIEHDMAQYEIAKENLSSLHPRRGLSFEIHMADASQFTLTTKSNVLFFFNPFGPNTFRAFMANNREKFKQEETFILLCNDWLLVDALDFGELIQRLAHFNLSVLRFKV